MKTHSIKNLMTKNVICVSPDQKLLDVKHIYEKKHFHHHIPVTKDDKLIGMISLADFMYSLNGAGLDDNDSIYTDKTVKDIMMPNPKYIDSSTSITETAQMLSKGRYRALPVVENGKMVGIITTADMIRHYLNE
ncbi:CBS domain-containing protein [Winogradskyella sp. DF17]|uniref:CBS domain-containing protein n=1 Tax=Winogradskyella pelagia TaxID=2819984 RepID=A0ABS3T4L5_9FLAO|nr:CBS domain-containing protein [Winogradskyella sp. DF17]MBO3117681.1 CBS domain-containing protein [Winogradskyella sp. DF17]